MEASAMRNMLDSLYGMKFPNSTRRETKLINAIGKKIRGAGKLTPDEREFVIQKIKQYKDIDHYRMKKMEKVTRTNKTESNTENVSELPVTNPPLVVSFAVCKLLENKSIRGNPIAEKWFNGLGWSKDVRRAFQYDSFEDAKRNTPDNCKIVRIAYTPTLYHIDQLILTNK